MKLAGIIAEYDPFHNGHAWQLAQAKALGAGRVAVAMSCGLTQRGALPLLPEAVRVRAALTCGADLVFALPAPCACAGAEAFARAGVRVLSAAGCDALVFGAETPDAALLMEAARILCSEDYRAALKAQLAAGARSFAAARHRAGGPAGQAQQQPCRRILQGHPRTGRFHDPRSPAPPRRGPRGGTLPGRRAVRQCQRPAPALAERRGRRRCPLRARRRAKCTGPEPFAAVRGVSEGLEHRLEHAVRTSSTHQELLDALTTVRYPRARMRRLAMDAALGYDAALPPLPPYLHLLGARREALSLLKGAVLPVSHSLMRLREENPSCARMADAQLTASDLGALCRKTPEPMGGLLRQKIVFLTK